MYQGGMFMEEKINKTKIESLLERLGILEYKNKKVINLSGGKNNVLL